MEGEKGPTGTFFSFSYRVRTKVVLALTILVSIALGAMLFISHALSQIHLDRLLRWLMPACFSLLVFTIISLIIILFVGGTRLHDDLHGLESLLSTNVFNGEFLRFDEKRRVRWRVCLDTDPRVTPITSMSHQVKISWCFGMEILALQFAVVSLILYALMFVVKQRPED